MTWNLTPWRLRTERQVKPGLKNVNFWCALCLHRGVNFFFFFTPSECFPAKKVNFYYRNTWFSSIFLSGLCLLGAKCKVSHAQAAPCELQPKFWPHTSSEAIPHEQKPWSKPEQGSLQLSLPVFLTGAYYQQHEQGSNAYGSLPSSATEDITRRNLEQGTQPCLPVSSQPCPASSQRAGAAWLSWESPSCTACAYTAALPGLPSSNLTEMLPLEQPPSSQPHCRHPQSPCSYLWRKMSWCSWLHILPFEIHLTFSHTITHTSCTYKRAEDLRLLRWKQEQSKC